MTREELIILMDDFIGGEWRAFLEFVKDQTGEELTEEQYNEIIGIER